MEPAKKQTALIHELEGSHFDLLTGRDRFSCRGPGTGTNYEKSVNGTRNSVRKFQPGKRAHLFRFSTFSGNFPVGRTDETCSIYRQPEIPEILTKWKAPYISTASYPDASLRAKEDGLCSPLSPSQGSLRFGISRVSRSPLCAKRKNEANKEEADM